MSSLLKLLFIISACTMLFACTASNNLADYAEISESQNSLEYISAEKEYSKLLEVLSDKPSIETLHKTVCIDFIKIVRDGYSTLFLTDEGLVEVKFDANKNHLSTKRIILNPDISESDMAQISVGDSLAFVRSVDPQGDYSFLYTSHNGIPAISNHYLENGTCYTIHYDETWHVAEVEKRLI